MEKFITSSDSDCQGIEEQDDDPPQSLRSCVSHRPRADGPDAKRCRQKRVGM